MARLMWAQFPGLYMELSTYNVWGDGNPVLVLDASQEAHEKRVEAGARALFHDRCPGEKWAGWEGGLLTKACRSDAKLVLSALGLNPVMKGAQKL
jgi:hypothetical protein